MKTYRDGTRDIYIFTAFKKNGFFEDVRISVQVNDRNYNGHLAMTKRQEFEEDLRKLLDKYFTPEEIAEREERYYQRFA